MSLGGWEISSTSEKIETLNNKPFEKFLARDCQATLKSRSSVIDERRFLKIFLIIIMLDMPCHANCESENKR